MLNTDVYNSAIQDIWFYLMLNMLPLLVCGILLIVITVLGISKRLMKKSIAVCMIVLSIILLTYSITEISLFNYDVQHANFDFYHGEFDYMQVSGNEKDVFEFPRESNLSVRSVADLKIQSGTHHGYILYCKTSRWVIAYSSVPFE